MRLRVISGAHNSVMPQLGHRCISIARARSLTRLRQPVAEPIGQRPRHPRPNPQNRTYSPALWPGALFAKLLVSQFTDS